MFRLDRSWSFPVPPAELWAALARTEDFPRWWPWLASFEVEGGAGAGLAEGATAEVVVRAPVPWALRLTVRVERVDVGSVVEGVVAGDLSGPASLEVSGQADGSASCARLVWELTPASPLLRAVARVARPALEWGQRWVLDTGVAQFRRQALGGR